MRSGLTTLLLAFAIYTCGYSQDKNHKNEIGFRSDNDSFLGYGQDRYYTNGLTISFRHAAKQDTLATNLEKKIWEIEAGHYIFNPYTGKIEDVASIDRPFAAYLFVGGKKNWYFKDERVLELSLNIGTIGPDALGEEVQKGLHRAVGFYTIKGWEYQIKNEVGVNASVKYSKLLLRKSDNDYTLNSYANLGNTFSGFGLGVLLRLGQFNKLFNSVSTSSRISNNLNDSIPKKEFFFFTRPMANFVMYDATIEGRLFAKNEGSVIFNPNRFQYSQEFGLNYALNRWTLNFSVTFKSRDVKTQDKPHQYGSAFIYYRF